MQNPRLSTLGDLARMREIVTIFAKYGLSGFVDRLRLSVRPLRKQPEDSGRRYGSMPQRVRMACEELGPTFIKLGQILSTRVDVFGLEWTEEFAKLQSSVRPISGEEVVGLIESRLGCSIDEVFSSFDETPIGSASVAQVHRARLVGGEEVAVKITRPGIDEVMAADLRILNHIAQLIESEIPESRAYHPVQMVQFFARSLVRETDLLYEMRYLQRFARMYNGHGSVHIPKVFTAHSNRQILVQEYIDDTLLSDPASGSLNASEKRALAERITDIFLGMILQHGFFHADPHPGNIFVGKNGSITLIDFGLVGQIGLHRRQEMMMLIQALIERDTFAMQFVLGSWAQEQLPDEDLLGADVLEMMMNYEHMSIQDVRISQVINDITQITRTHGLTLPADLVLLFKCLITLDGVVKQLDGDFELLRYAKPVMQGLLKHTVQTRALWQHSKVQAQLLAQAADLVPQNVLLLMRRMRQGQLGINLDIKRIEQLNTQLDKATNRLTMGVVTAALIIGSSIVMNINAGPKIFGLSFFGLVGYLLAFGNSLWVIWSIWRSGRH